MKKLGAVLFATLLLCQMVAAQRILMRRATMKPRTHGSRYFFTHYVRGFVVETSDSLIKKPGYIFNYDKVDGLLVMAMGAKSELQFYRAKVKSFTLYSAASEPYVFERVPAIDTGRFLQVLSLGAKYKIYKLIKTDFVRANYQTDGVLTTGNRYDEFMDDYTYYTFNVVSGHLQKFNLKNRALMAAFAGDEEKAGTYLADHPADNIDDAYLTGLGEFMNN